ncbi:MULTISPECIES: YdaS family helix-turn-helix protein [unclassified Caballeronia]|uniref:YdaS family helix-turn-helix protein n=1 Tax=unclassified Caballeronia TaxID=2646786 RepID=UPI002857A7FA|nr:MULTISPECIES: YdaS family helix-turn-helix protein [unclassified Caballeronia]MDR5772095.1 YdaS family helix-turn-helix protein [Caballeronia sp. LZ002]MDR5847529.1 YdaS family helix-turn-helix protein [Caballeronia sp. LZ003]
MSIIKNAILEAGGAVAVARAFGIDRISVYNWVYKDEVPAGRVVRLAELTGWKHTPHALAPNLYPNPTDGLPVDVSGIT